MLSIKKKRKNEKLKSERKTVSDSAEAFSNFIEKLNAFITNISNYATSLNEIGYYLQRVVINDKPFDNYKCNQLAKSINEETDSLNVILNDFNTAWGKKDIL